MKAGQYLIRQWRLSIMFGMVFPFLYGCNPEMLDLSGFSNNYRIENPRNNGFYVGTPDNPAMFHDGQNPLPEVFRFTYSQTPSNVKVFLNGYEVQDFFSYGATGAAVESADIQDFLMQGMNTLQVLPPFGPKTVFYLDSKGPEVVFTDVNIGVPNFTVKGYLKDESAIASMYINNNSVTVNADKTFSFTGVYPSSQYVSVSATDSLGFASKVDYWRPVASGISMFDMIVKEEVAQRMLPQIEAKIMGSGSAGNPSASVDANRVAQVFPEDSALVQTMKDNWMTITEGRGDDLTCGHDANGNLKKLQGQVTIARLKSLELQNGRFGTGDIMRPSVTRTISFHNPGGSDGSRMQMLVELGLVHVKLVTRSYWCGGQFFDPLGCYPRSATEVYNHPQCRDLSAGVPDDIIITGYPDLWNRARIDGFVRFKIENGEVDVQLGPNLTTRMEIGFSALMDGIIYNTLEYNITNLLNELRFDFSVAASNDPDRILFKSKNRPWHVKANEGSLSMYYKGNIEAVANDNGVKNALGYEYDSTFDNIHNKALQPVDGANISMVLNTNYINQALYAMYKSGYGHVAIINPLDVLSASPTIDDIHFGAAATDNLGIVGDMRIRLVPASPGNFSVLGNGDVAKMLVHYAGAALLMEKKTETGWQTESPLLHLDVDMQASIGVEAVNGKLKLVYADQPQFRINKTVVNGQTMDSSIVNFLVDSALGFVAPVLSGQKLDIDLPGLPPVDTIHYEYDSISNLGQHVLHVNPGIEVVPVKIRGMNGNLAVMLQLKNNEN